MKTDFLLRFKLGLTQVQLAQYLGVTRSQVAMYEKGMRELPTAALLKMAEIELELHRAKAAGFDGHPHTAVQQANARQALHKHAKQLEYAHQKAVRALAKQQQQYQQNITLLNILKQLKSNQAAAPVQASMLQGLQTAAQRHMQKNSLARQMVLQTTIHGLQQQLQHTATLKKSLD
ncbi:helix-turn-helix transcriptional regulator [Ferruginibacter paludis]|uniref:helix-turn-helix domain-containing protein n=1 Tax=Ferruginibacter paludis TaxID=1310417 RepID=UPI0025B4F2A0|nr:helix-turn-helix transcriptional regulator [Ferruginibacter paludis]MDN3657242.1 helix-turn-helix transcriptional regulator [Ferruginibacter paludis]